MRGPSCRTTEDGWTFATAGQLLCRRWGHAALSTTQRYIEADVEAQRRVVI